LNFNSGKEIVDLCNHKGKKIYELMIEREIELQDITEAEIRENMAISLNIMKKAVEDSITKDIISISGLIGGDAKKIYENESIKGGSICGSMMKKAIAYSMGVLEVNASMGKIVAAPTAGSSGIIPGAIIALQEEHDLPDTDIINALITSSAIGLIVSKNATVAGAEGGCQAETGTAAAMAAGAIVEMMGGTVEQSFHAAATSLKNILGLVCDPIAGLVEAPCEKRNAIGASNALISAEMALCGVESIIPFDEVVDAMYKIGRSLPFELKETALGGLADTETGRRIKKEIHSN